MAVAYRKMGQRSKVTRQMKLAIIGDKHVGKTSLVTRYIHDVFSPHYTYTQGGELRKLDVSINDVNVRVTIVDTAGHMFMRSLIKILYRDVQGIMVVFDLTRETTFKSLPQWFSQIEEVNVTNPVIFFVGNKLDLTTHRTVPYNQARARSEQHEAQYFETSAKTGENVRETFLALLRATWQHVVPRYFPMESITVHSIADHEDCENKASCCSVT